GFTIGTNQLDRHRVVVIEGPDIIGKQAAAVGKHCFKLKWDEGRRARGFLIIFLACSCPIRPAPINAIPKGAILIKTISLKACPS
ncbi:MAG TPA: hypothetical protein VIH54_13530, partial [Chthoniobacterales bacterium]